MRHPLEHAGKGDDEVDRAGDPPAVDVGERVWPHVPGRIEVGRQLVAMLVRGVAAMLVRGVAAMLVRGVAAMLIGHRQEANQPSGQAALSFS